MVGYNSVAGLERRGERRERVTDRQTDRRVASHPHASVKDMNVESS